MRVNSNKQWYEYEADKNRIYSINIYPGLKNPKKYIIDLKCAADDQSIYYQFITNNQHKPREVNISTVLMIINTISAVQKTKPAVYFYEDKSNETTTYDT